VAASLDEQHVVGGDAAIVFDDRLASAIGATLSEPILSFAGERLRWLRH
jgi:hypothetical protein